MQTSQKGFINILLPIIVLIFVAVGAGIYFYSDKAPAENVVQNNQDEFANWKKYTDDQNVVEFLYPGDLKFAAKVHIFRPQDNFKNWLEYGLEPYSGMLPTVISSEEITLRNIQGNKRIFGSPTYLDDPPKRMNL